MHVISHETQRQGLRAVSHAFGREEPSEERRDAFVDARQASVGNPGQVSVKAHAHDVLTLTANPFLKRIIFAR
jgi:hypothetical protein